MGEALKQAEVDHIIDHVPLKVGSSIQWEHEGKFLKCVVPVVGAAAGSVNAAMVLDLRVSTTLPGKYTFQLRQTGASEAVILRRLDVRGSHSNKSHVGNTEEWHFRTHKHRWRDACGDSFAYTPGDIPDTTAPPDSPNPGEHEDVFKAFWGECGIDEAGAWTPPPLGLDEATAPNAPGLDP